MKHWTALTICLVSALISLAAAKNSLSNLKVLDTDNLLLLNVAVKGHLVEKLSDSISEMQTLRGKLADDVKQCLTQVSQTAQACRKCVKETCEKRAVECKLNITRMETFVIEEESIPIPGVQFLRQPAPVEQGIQGLAQNAKKDILEGVPSNLRGESEGLLVNTETKLQTLQDRLQNSVHELPNVIPRMHNSINNMEIALEDTEILNNMANIAAEQIAGAIHQQGIFKQSADRVMQQLPSVMSNMNQKLQRFSSAVGNFMSLANSRLGNLMAAQQQQVPRFPQQQQQWPQQNQGRFNVQQNRVLTQGNQWPQQNQQWVQNSNTRVVQRPAVQLPQNNVQLQQNAQLWRQQNAQVPSSWNGQNSQFVNQQTMRQNIAPQNSWGTNTGGGQIFISQNAANRRFKREVAVTCENLKVNAEKACQDYHFQCPACLNESNIMKHACGNDTIQKMVEIKKLDLLSAKHLLSYHQYMKNGLIVMQVEYDEDSYSIETKTYKKAYITAKIGKEFLTYETPLLPNLEDLKTSGDEIGDEIWKLLQDKKVFELELKKAEEKNTTPIKQNEVKIIHRSLGFQVDTDQSSAGVVARAMWSVIGVVMYIGIQAFVL